MTSALRTVSVALAKPLHPQHIGDESLVDVPTAPTPENTQVSAWSCRADGHKSGHIGRIGCSSRKTTPDHKCHGKRTVNKASPEVVGSRNLELDLSRKGTNVKRHMTRLVNRPAAGSRTPP